MGWRINRHVSLGKHVRLNVSKSGIGISGGVRGARVSYNPKTGVRTSAGIPGTGIYYTEQHKINGNKNNVKAMPSPARLKPKVWPYVVGVVATLFLSGLFKSVTLFWILFVIISVAYFGFVIYSAIKART